jgi:NAD-dependent SIR2 family protein deacetylase
MFIQFIQRQQTYTRSSKLGQEHTYSRTKTFAVFRCDNCGKVFERERGRVSSKRFNNHYFHVCSKCDAKRFAQRKGIERKHIWDKPASIADDISKL